MNRQKINLGVPFTLVRPSANEKEFVVDNLNTESFDFLKCEILNSTSYPPPSAFITDKDAKIIKLQGFERIPQTTSLEIIVQGVVAQKNVTVEQKPLLSDATLENLKDMPANVGAAVFSYLKRGLMLFFGLSFALYLVKGSSFGDWLNTVWSKFNAAQFVEMATDIDPRIATNGHVVYQSAAFTQMNADYKRAFGSDHDLRKYYRFVGNRDIDGRSVGFFVTSDLVSGEKGDILKFSQSKADDHCATMGGQLLTRDELRTYLADNYVGVENFFWPIKRRGKIPEWTDDSYSWIFRKGWLYVKETKTDENAIDGFIVAGKGTKAAFRCGFPETYFVEAK